MAISVPHNYGLLPSLHGGRKMTYTHIGKNCAPFSNVSFFVLTLWRVIESEYTLRNWKIVRLKDHHKTKSNYSSLDQCGISK